MVDKANDAIALWQQMIGDMQKGFSAFTDQAIAASGARKTAEPDAQKQLAELMETYCVSMNLPSRAQLDAVAGRLLAIEAQLAEIKVLLHQNQATAKPASRPRKRRRPNSSASKIAKTENIQSGRE